ICVILLVIVGMSSCDFSLNNWFDRDTEAVIKVSYEDGVLGGYIGRIVTVDGSSSVCGPNDTLIYSWTLKEKPIGSAISLGSTPSEKITFIPDIADDYIIELIVVDDDKDDDDKDDDDCIKTISVKGKPGIPTGLEVNDTGVDTVELAWNISPDATEYAIYRDGSLVGFSAGSFEGTDYIDPPTEFRDEGLQPGTVYSYKVSAENPAGESEKSLPAVSAITRLAIPENFHSEENTLTTVDLAWDGSTNAATYFVEKRKESETSFEEAYEGSTLNCQLEDLDSGQVYFFRITALNSVGATSELSTNIRVNLGLIPLPPPNNVIASSETQSSITISWDSVEGAYAYNVYRASSESGTYSLITPPDNTYTTTTTSYLDSDPPLSSGVRYYYKVSTINQVIDDGSAVLLEGAKSESYGTGITIPADPSDLVVANPTYHSLKVEWTSVTGADEYKLYRAASPSGSYIRVPTIPPIITSPPYIDEGLDWNTTYYYKVTASNSSGESGKSDYANETTLSRPVYTITATAGTGGSIVPSGEVTVPHGEDKTFTFNEDTGYTISRVEVDGENVDWDEEGGIPSYTFSDVEGDHTIDVFFSLDPSSIGKSPSSFSFGATEGANNPSSQTLSIWRSAGSQPLDWSVSDNAAWLSLSPSSGSSTGETDSVTVSVNIDGLADGTYNGTITILADGATNSPQTLPITLIVDDNNVTNVNATDGNYDYIRITWDSVPRATSYDIYRSTSSSGTYLPCGTYSPGEIASTVEYNDYSADVLSTYWYKVRAVFGEKIGPYSSSDNGYAMPEYSNIDREQWIEGSLTTGNDQWYRVYLYSGNTYSIVWDDSYQGSSDYSCDIKVTAKKRDYAYFTGVDSGYNSPRTITPTSTGYVYLQVQGYNSSSSGSYGFIITKFAPGVRLNSANPKAYGGMSFSSYGAEYDTYYTSDPHWKINYIGGYLEFTFYGQKDFNYNIQGSTQYGTSYCYVDVYINGGLYIYNWFIEPGWKWWYTPASEFTSGNNTIRFVLKQVDPNYCTNFWCEWVGVE
ncbi:hypothetical protein KAR91_29640, partial [Candidatus Pacearchaeota archaeon]|nr:hypothetical protein [Candidatus Pacearchaeota archaeon]